jgi:hypothetical protein
VVTFRKPQTVMAAPLPPFPQQIPQNEESSGFQTVCRKTWVIILPMTRHKATQTGLGNPSPPDHWINALLRGLAMLVSHVAKRFASPNQTSAAECDGDCEPVREASFVLDQHQEPTLAAASSQTIQALMVSSTRSSRPSNHEGGLTAPSTSHSRASEARPENLWATPTNAAPALAAQRFSGHFEAARKGRFGPVDQIEGRRPGQGPRMTRGWVCGEQSTVGAPN